MSKFIPNSFQVANELVDELLRDMSGAELKCYLFIVRKTRGWQKNEDAISISQMVDATGLSNRAVIDACNSLVEKGLFAQSKGVRGVKIFSIDVCNNFTSEKSSLVKKVHSTSEKSSQVTSEKSSHTKDTIKNTTQKTSSVVNTPLQMLIEQGCDEQLAKDFIAHRKTKKAAVTQTVVKLIASQAQKAGISFARAIEITIARNWQSFNASWKWQDDQPTGQQSKNKWDAFLDRPEQTKTVTPDNVINFAEVRHG